MKPCKVCKFNYHLPSCPNYVERNDHDEESFIIEGAIKRQGINIKDTEDIRDLIRYVKNIGYNEGYNDGCKVID